ncbi:hypothetical protein OYT00_11200 [Microbacterium paraoxydans]|uniref:hypothetical protein n=1 Tax=Microbacterium paraoxydans TaxID=199592 RepID=UPI002286226D|nr:hypothetical protein [Microbacterium paraoxydans]MCZ0710567.1 hypothetical protein [Microbacterium paraoxydans]
MHRPFPPRKTLGTRFNLRPATAMVEAQRLQPGDVVVIDDECPVLIASINRKHGRIRIWGKFIWQTERELHWKVGTFAYTQRLTRALPGEYRSSARSDNPTH